MDYTEIYLHIHGNDDEATESFFHKIIQMVMDADEDDLPDFQTFNVVYTDGMEATITNLPGQCDDCLQEMLDEEEGQND